MNTGCECLTLEMKILMTISAIFKIFQQGEVIKIFQQLFSHLLSARICYWVEEVEDLKVDEIRSQELHYYQWNQAGQVFGKSEIKIRSIILFRLYFWKLIRTILILKFTWISFPVIWPCSWPGKHKFRKSFWVSIPGFSNRS